MAISRGYNVTNFHAVVNGMNGGYLTQFGPPTYEGDAIKQALGPDGVTKMMVGKPKIGDAKCSYNISEAGPLIDLMNQILKKNVTHFDAYVALGNQDYKIQRAISMLGCLPKEFGFSKLDSKDGKKLFEVNLTFAVEDMKYEKGGDAIKSNLSNKAKSWLCAHFHPVGIFGGIPPQSITAIDLCKYTAKISEEHTGMLRQPTRQAAAWEVAGHKIEGQPSGFEAAKDHVVKCLYDGEINEGDFVDWSVNIMAPNNKDIIGEVVFIQSAPQKFTWAPELKGGGDSMATWTIDCITEEMRIEPKHKA